MDRLIKSLVIGVLLTTSLALSAQPVVTITPQNVAVDPGQEFSVDVVVSNFNDILSMQFPILWDPGVLEFLEVTNINSDAVPGLGPNLFGFVPSKPGKLTFSWFDNNLAGISVPDGTVIFSLKFRALVDGATPVEIKDDPDLTIEVIDSNEDELGMTTQESTVTVGDGGGAGSGTFRMSLTDHDVLVGEEVCISLNVDNFTDLTALQFSLSYDTNLLQYKESRNVNTQVSGLDGGALSRPSPGILVFDWSDVSANSLNNGAILLDICFDAVGSGTTNVRFTNNPVAIEATQQTGGGSQNLNFETDNSILNITEENVGGNGFELILGSAAVEPGASVCLPIRVGDFQDILGLQFSISYDANLLQFTEAVNFNSAVSGLDANALANPAPGSIRFSWNDISFTGADLPDGDVLFELCFTTVASGTATVAFSNSPLTIEVTQKVGSDGEQIIDSNTQNGTVTIQGDTGGGSSGPGFTGFGLYLEDVNVQSGESFCVPVKVQDFTDILGMQFSMAYDPNVLELTDITGFGLNGLSAGSIGNVSPGVITVSWFDPNVEGQTLADGSILFELCFVATGSNGAATPISFTDTPTPAEFIQVNGSNEQIIDHNFRDGTVQIGEGSGGGPPFEGFGLIIGDQMVESGVSFCVPITVQDFQEILGMQFSISYNPNHLEFQSAQNFGLDGLNAGGVGDISPGVLTVSWYDPNVTGQTLPDGAVLMELCFLARAPNGTTSVISLSNSPTPIEFVQNQNGNEETIDYNSKSGTITIDVGGALTIDSPASITNVSCFGESSGAVNISVQGGSGSYSYLWSYQNVNTEDLVNIPAGTYTVTVTDNGTNETVTETFDVSEPPAPLSADIQVQNTDCGAQAGQSNGAITLDISGGTPQYNIDWSGSLPDDLTEQTGLAAGQYAFTVTDARGCTFNSGPVEVEEEGVVESTLSPTYIAPSAPGAVDLTVDSGDGPFSYQWSGPDNFSAADEDISGLTQTGRYCVTITDANGCESVSCIEMYEVLRFATVEITNSCAGDNNGSIVVDVAGGRTPLSYSWSTGGSNTATLGNLGPGNYSLTVTDDKGDVVSGTFEVSELSALTIDASIDPVTGEMNNNNGAVSLSVSGGRPGYTITWDSGATGTQINNLSTGQYCVTVTDANGCSAEECFDVNFQAIPLSFDAQTTATSCAGESDGRLTINIEGGNDPYVVVFEDGPEVNSNNGLVNRADLPGGNIRFTVRDENGTTIQGEATIPEPDPIQIAEAIVVHDTEAAGCTGSIRLSLTGGTPDYSVIWNSPNTGSQIINLCAGPFIPTVADANGCTRTFDPIEVTSFAIRGDVTNATCPNEANGAIALNVSGGSTPYSYRWANAAGEVISTDAELNDALPGQYSVTVSESSGNNLVREFTVGASSNLSVGVEVVSDFNGFGVSCPDAADGVLRAEGANGLGAYMYEWVRDGEMVGVDAMLSDAVAGQYEVTAIDESGCVVSTQITLQAPPDVVISPNISQISCHGDRDGAIEVRAAGGAGSTFYDFKWNTGDNGSEIRNLRAGTYTVTVTDDFECRTVRSFELQEPEPLQVIVETKPANDGCNGSARAIVTGGTRPYFYTWNSSQTDSIINNLCPDTYFVEVEDSRGCKPDSQVRTSGLVSDRRFACMEASKVLTLNDDGDNELFEINCIEEFPENQLEVYNRWGQIVFEAENYDNTWRGTDARGERLPEGPYYFVLQYMDGNGESQQLKGSLTVLRDD